MAITKIAASLNSKEDQDILDHLPASGRSAWLKDALRHYIAYLDGKPAPTQEATLSDVVAAIDRLSEHISHGAIISAPAPSNGNRYTQTLETQEDPNDPLVKRMVGLSGQSFEFK